jgi:hypothetical protein
LIFELIQFFDEDEVFLSILEETMDGDQVMVPLASVGLIPAAVAALQNA